MACSGVGEARITNLLELWVFTTFPIVQNSLKNLLLPFWQVRIFRAPFFRNGHKGLVPVEYQQCFTAKSVTKK